MAVSHVRQIMHFLNIVCFMNTIMLGSQVSNRNSSGTTSQSSKSFFTLKKVSVGNDISSNEQCRYGYSPHRPLIQLFQDTASKYFPVIYASIDLLMRPMLTSPHHLVCSGRGFSPPCDQSRLFEYCCQARKVQHKPAPHRCHVVMKRRVAVKSAFSVCLMNSGWLEPQPITCDTSNRLLQNDTHDCFGGKPCSHIVLDLPKLMSRQPIDPRCLCSQIGYKNYCSVTVTSHCIRISSMSSARFGEDKSKPQVVNFLILYRLR